MRNRVILRLHFRAKRKSILSASTVMTNAKSFDAVEDNSDAPMEQKNNSGKKTESKKDKQASTEEIHPMGSKRATASDIQTNKIEKEDKKAEQTPTGVIHMGFEGTIGSDVSSNKVENEIERQMELVTPYRPVTSYNSSGRCAHGNTNNYTQVHREENEVMPDFQGPRRRRGSGGNQEEQMDDIVDDYSTLPGAYQVPGLTEEQDDLEMPSAMTSDENQPIQAFAVVANLAPSDDQIQVENHDLRRQLEQERDRRVVAGSAKVIHTWICGLSRRQILYLFAFVLVVVTIAVAVTSSVPRELKNDLLSTPRPTSTWAKPTPSPTLSPSSIPLIFDLLTKADPRLDLLEVLDTAPFRWIVNDMYTIIELDELHEINPLILYERYALAVLYFGTGGENWSTQFRFLSPISHCEWHQRDDQGVFCNDDGLVERIDIDENNLLGTIPTQIGNLFTLQILSLRDNILTGIIPTAIGNLSNLHQLWLYNNFLSGEIPTQVGNLINIQALSLYNNNLNSPIPTHIGNLSNLIELALNDNDMTGKIPTQVGALLNLRYLRFHGNNFSGSIPNEIVGLSNLLTLALHFNNLTGTIPTQVGSLRNLERLGLFENNLIGTIPNKIGDLSNLLLLDAHSNSLTGTIPTEVGNLMNLEELYLNLNNLTHTIPNHIGNLSSLLELALFENKLTGTIPTHIGALRNLKRLGLYDNDLTGPIPTQVGALLNLEYLGIQINSLTGTIPTEFGNLSSMERLNLGSNNFTGTLPNEVENLLDLRYAWLYGNNLTGEVDPLFCDGALTSLEKVYIDCIPPTISCSCCENSEGNSC